MTHCCTTIGRCSSYGKGRYSYLVVAEARASLVRLCITEYTLENFRLGYLYRQDGLVYEKLLFRMRIEPVLLVVKFYLDVLNDCVNTLLHTVSYEMMYVSTVSFCYYCRYAIFPNFSRCIPTLSEKKYCG